MRARPPARIASPVALYGILGDIHGNREALEATLERIDAIGVDRLLCVGDVIGYNADPDECVRMLQSRGGVSTVTGRRRYASASSVTCELVNPKPEYH